jgi:hypothetical protein
MTNNPRKVSTLEQHGVKVVERVPVRSASHSENHHYLATKALKLGHHMDWLPEYIPSQTESEDKASKPG